MSAQPPDEFVLTDEERAWITEHPVVRVGVMADVSPIEYMQDGTLKGLSSEYLDNLARKTGLTFTYVPATPIDERIDLLLNKQIDMISAVRLNSPVGEDPRLIHTSSYLNTTAVVVTRMQHPPIMEGQQLNGLTVTVPYPDRYREVMARKAPGAKLIVGSSAMGMLQQVDSGEVDAAIATEAYLLPFLYREFQGRLQISGVLADVASLVGMSTRRDDVILHGIIQKAFSSLSAEETRLIHASWLQQHVGQAFSISDLVARYPHEVVLITLVVLLLMALVYLTHRMRRRAERNEQEKTMFLAVMSHEIRSPMNAVLAAVELLRNTPLDKQQQHFADLANNGANSLLTLLNDVLDISKLDAGQVKLEFEPVNVAALVRNVVDLQCLRAREKHISLTVDGQADLPLLMLDEARLGQVLHNLISNAIKFTEVGGVEVSFSVTNGHSVKHKHLHIAVTDTGIGITEEAQARLFQPYVQAARMYKRSGGTGLGLAICRDLLKLMQGTISLSSEPGKGTRVALSLLAEVAPATAAPAEMPAVSGATHSGQVNNLRILVVEDTPANQAVLQAQIEGFGCTPVIARDGAQAIACFEQGVYDLVLMDCDLPDQDGYSLTTLFRIMEQDSEQTRCPIIAISASTDNKHITRCFDSGMDGILGKPISLGKLQDAIELWCGVTLTLLPMPFASQGPLGNAQIHDALEQDLHALLEAMVLRNADAARHAVHRLHGAALSIEWPEIAGPANTIEDLLRADTPLDAAAYTPALEVLVSHFRTTSFPSPLSVRPSAHELS
ncbi:ATP-binding protein [Pseudomonas sp. GD03944]|uniref:ATP-binding protein n=1 Tax=Pseudomonas sp. GD03944 TaxID=2975409 RepID=UPI00244B6541|nr:ATP-binding protein [Pseudomonas sp. GD03944]MDH1263154.1 ATP-binding protein [Pseudomonas sp. GD03944]